jgi:hypothetical protein
LTNAELESEEKIKPLSASEVMMYIEHRRKSNPTVMKGTLAEIKPAVLKFRQLNGFSTFTEREKIELSRYFKGLSNQISQKVRDGNMKTEEYIALANDILNSKINTKFMSEVYLAKLMS